MGTLVCPQYIRVLFVQYGWRATYRIQAAIFLGVYLPAIIVTRQIRKPEGAVSDKNSTYGKPSDDDYAIEVVEAGHSPAKHWHYHRTYWDLFTDKKVFMLFLSQSLFALGCEWAILSPFSIISDTFCILDFVPMTYVITYARDHIGMTLAAATWAVSIVGICSTVGRVIIAPICDALPNWHMTIYIIQRILNGAAVFLLPYTNSIGTLYAACAVFGLSAGENFPISIAYMMQ